MWYSGREVVARRTNRDGDAGKGGGVHNEGGGGGGWAEVKSWDLKSKTVGRSVLSPHCPIAYSLNEASYTSCNIAR